MKAQKYEVVRRPGLENVFMPPNQWHDRIYYDPKEGKYYDAYADLYLELDQLQAYGLNR